MVLTVRCSGSPYEIGRAHGSQAGAQIKSSIEFYTGLFQRSAGMSWAEVQQTALEFVPSIQSKWPMLLEEMQGIADAAGLQIADVVALNVRTEITFGMFTDGCTALAWKTQDTVFLAQNWDWMQEQKSNILLYHIEQDGYPSIQYLAEAGLIGKIGLNSAGVGVCVNAIRAKGMDPEKLPMHLALRLLLNSTSMDTAVEAMENYGVASSCHFLVGDPSGAVGLEWTHLGLQKLPLKDNRIHHANHLLLDHPGVVDTRWIPDSVYRTHRIEELTDEIHEVTATTIQAVFSDEGNFPGSICKTQTGSSDVATLFNIVMDLREVKADVIMGRPNAPEETLSIKF